MWISIHYISIYTKIDMYLTGSCPDTFTELIRFTSVQDGIFVVYVKCDN